MQSLLWSNRLSYRREFSGNLAYMMVNGHVGGDWPVVMVMLVEVVVVELMVVMMVVEVVMELMVVMVMLVEVVVVELMVVMIVVEVVEMMVVMLVEVVDMMGGGGGDSQCNRDTF